MFIRLRNLTFIFFGILIILELISILINLIILEKSLIYNKNDEKTQKIMGLNILTSCSGITIDLFSLIIILIFGVHSLYFKVKFKLALYLIL